jgi:hypothetical protein
MKGSAFRFGRPWWLISLGAVATGIAGMSTPERGPTARTAVQQAPIPAVERVALPERQLLAKARGDPFAPRSWAVPVPSTPPVAAPPEPIPAPGAPVNPYRFAGTARYAGSLKAVLIRDEQVHLAEPGHVLDGGYRVLSVTREEVTVLYTPLDLEQRLAFSAQEPVPPLPK